MRNKKNLKLLSLLLALALVFSLVGCQTSEPATNVEEPVAQQESVAVETPKEPEKPVVNMDRSDTGKNGMLATAKPEASEVGIEIMKNGGNAIDAAVATAFALGVVEPNASGLGGGGFMIIRFAETGEEAFFDFREVAPGNATADMYELDEEGKVVNEGKTVGGKAAGIPGEVAGLLTALETYGSMSREEVMQPAIDIAENGFLVTDNFVGIIQDNFEKINKFDATKEIYLKNGLPFEAGDTIKNPDLAETLKIIVKEGKDGFYKGQVAEDIVKAANDAGGIFALEDLANYELKMREPVKGTYRGYEIISAPPSSSGGTHVIQLLNILENFDVKGAGHNTTEGLHLWSEASKLMFADRGKYMADTDFVDVPLAGLASKDYAKVLAEGIDKTKAAEKVSFGDPYKYESGSTTHFSVMDKEGNMVAVTKTINYFFGSGVGVPGRGFILNNEMDDFNAEPGTSNSVEPGKRPLSSMTPTLVLKDGEPFMTLGSPGATRIIGSVAQIISNVIDHDMDIQDAVNAPRMFNQRGTLSVESRMDKDVLKELEAMGHEIDIRGELDAYFGGAQCIIMEEGLLHGAGDPRRDGQAVGF
ncbi:MAG: gamma-glutamyltransferase [Tissierellia bacterium]|nr:gamma-glutamyltransferase [Tissierellia bacterium]MDD4725950.1 gamma-glutamyltransferase [Tissierellia bacterium]